MNKYQEALDRIKTAPSFMGGTKEYRYSTQSSTPFLEDIAVLQELVDKEIPKKYKSKTDKDGRMIWVCPKCNEILVKFWSEVETVSHLPYCYMCGQKLDWSECENE